MLLKYKVELEVDGSHDRAAVEQTLHNAVDDTIVSVNKSLFPNRAQKVQDSAVARDIKNADYLHTAVTRESVGAPWTAKATVVLR